MCLFRLGGDLLLMLLLGLTEQFNLIKMLDLNKDMIRNPFFRMETERIIR